MKDALNRSINVGDVILYAVRRGSTQDMKIAHVREIKNGGLVVKSAEFHRACTFCEDPTGFNIASRLAVITNVEQTVRFPIAEVPSHLLAAITE